MKIVDTPIPDLVEIIPDVYGDDRGYFFESYNKKSFLDKKLETGFIQDNQSLSHKGVLRGLHFQNPPHAQGKLVRVIIGSVLDVALDIRKGSPTYGQHYTTTLSGENKKMLWIPKGFAHGFLTLEDHTIFSYKCTGFYNKNSEGSILWDDPDLNINWNIKNVKLSDKDNKGVNWVNFKSQFVY